MNIQILWVDDEIDLLRPHIIFLEEKGYALTTANSGNDAIDIIKNQNFDLVFLDENMPGLTGLQTLAIIKEIKPTLPVVMVTKSEEENIMDLAIGSKIADYLIKPVSPKQVLLAIKKNVHSKQLVTEKTTTDYRTEFGVIGQLIASANSFDNWVEIYKKLVTWSIQIAESSDPSIGQVLEMQWSEANNEYGKLLSVTTPTGSMKRPMISLYYHQIYSVARYSQRLMRGKKCCCSL